MKRFRWTQKHRHWTEDWKKVLRTEKSKFGVFRSPTDYRIRSQELIVAVLDYACVPPAAAQHVSAASRRLLSNLLH